MSRTRFFTVTVVLGLLLPSSMARADGPQETASPPATAALPPLITSLSTDPPTAAELFVQGRAAMAANRYDEACPKFSESFRLDPHVGSLISLAECEAAAGHLALARTHWQQAIDFAHRIGDPRETAAADRFAEIDARVPRLTLRLGSGARSEATVTKDGIVVSALSLATPLLVEVGDHVVSVNAPGYAPRTMTATLAEGERKDVVLELGPPLTPAVAGGLPEAQGAGAHPPRAKMKTAALIAGGVGAAAIVAGAGFGIATLVQSKQPNGDCPSGGSCDSQGQARNEAFVWGDVSTGLFIGGGVVVATAAVMWLIPARARQAATGWNVVPALGRGSGGLRVEGVF